MATRKRKPKGIIGYFVYTLGPAGKPEVRGMFASKAKAKKKESAIHRTHQIAWMETVNFGK